MGQNASSSPGGKKKGGGEYCLTFRSSFLPVSLHGHMGVQVVQRAICLLAPVPTALVHALNFFISSSRSLVLLGARNGDK